MKTYRVTWTEYHSIEVKAQNAVDALEVAAYEGAGKNTLQDADDYSVAGPFTKEGKKCTV